MKWWVAQDDSGLIHLFSEKPERYVAFNKLHYWAVKSGRGNSLLINNTEESFRYIDEHGILQNRMFADILGFKRKDMKDGILYYKGISMKEANEVEIEFNLKLL